MLGYANGSFISEIERGLKPLPRSKAAELAKALRTDEETLLNAVADDLINIYSKSA
jgi:hypothetical protein